MTITTTTAPKRTEQLTASPEEGAIPQAPVWPDEAAPSHDDRFDAGVRTLRVGSASVKLEERLLMVLGGVLAPLGLIIVLLGWWGAAHTPYVFEQLPYLISGGLLGVGLLFLGAFLYFAHWLTQLLKEHRTQSQAVIAALERLQDQMAAQRPTDPAPSVASTNGVHPAAVALVATERGTMAHRPDCAVVVGKAGLRAVDATDDLAPCKLCDPF